MTRWTILAAAIALSLTLAGCDKCGNVSFDIKSCSASEPKG